MRIGRQCSVLSAQKDDRRQGTDDRFQMRTSGINDVAVLGSMFVFRFSSFVFSLSCFVFLLVLGILSSPLIAQSRSVVKHHASGLQRKFAISTGSPRYQILNINNLTTWHRYDGLSNFSPSSDNGVYYPRGTGNVIYKDGIVWGGKVFRDPGYTIPYSSDPLNQNIRVGGGTYGIGTRGGAVNGSGANAVPEDPNRADVRAYRIRRDYATMTDYEYRRDAVSFFEYASVNDVTNLMIDQLRAQYEADWLGWPFAKGAPYIDRNRNGAYDPPPPFNSDPNAGPLFTAESLITQGRDEPGVSGPDGELPADQVLWMVYNDLDVPAAQDFVGSYPIGLEVQKTVWGYDRRDALGNIYFTRHVFINKGGVDTSDAPGDQIGSFWVDSMYVGQWSDPDLGSFSDDLVGVDTTLSLTYVYNANPVDVTFQAYNLPPPSAGYDFLAGPTVPGPGDSAVVRFQRAHNIANLGAYAFTYFSAGSPYSDPPGGYLYETGQWWSMLRGFQPLGDLTTPPQPFAHPPGTPPSRFPLSGDPVAGTGWLDGLGTPYSFYQGDRRFTMSTGPFQLAPGDTQEVYVGFVAGLGADRLSSVAVMKLYDRTVQAQFDNLFRVPRPPAEPKLTAVGLDREVILTWGMDAGRLQETEEKVIAGTFTFEGYNVYQLPAGTKRISNGVRIATFDEKNGVTSILEPSVDQLTGFPTMKLVQQGSDEGIQRSLRVTVDRLLDPENKYARDPLVNGKEYTFAVTAYNKNSITGIAPASLESEPSVVSVKTRIPFGISQFHAYGDTLPAVRNGPASDGTVHPIVVDPTRGTGDRFAVTFNVSDGALQLAVMNTSSAVHLFTYPLEDIVNGRSPVIDAGVMLRAENPEGLKPNSDGYEWNTTATRFVTWYKASFLDLEGFYGAAGWTAPVRIFDPNKKKLVPSSQLRRIQVRFAPTRTNLPGDFDSTDAEVSYAYRYLRSADQTASRPEFTPWITNTGPGITFQDYRPSLPLAVYDIDAVPPRRLAVGYTENNVPDGLVDGYYWPPYQSSPDNGTFTGPMEWLLVLADDYTGATANPAYQTDVRSDVNVPVMYTITWARRQDEAWVAGQSMDLIPYRSLAPADTFTFVVNAPTNGPEVERESAERIGVFPNPYYAYNAWAISSLRPFVTFNNLPPRAVIRIYNLAGHLVRTLRKDSDSQFFEWDLRNEDRWLVASGMYICHIELPDLNLQRFLKLAVIQENPVPD